MKMKKEGARMRKGKSRFLVIRGNAVKVRGDLQEFVVRFDEVQMFKGETIQERASVFQRNEWVEGVVKVKDVALIEDHTYGVPRTYVDVTLTSTQPFNLGINPVMLFYLGESEDNGATFEVAL